MANEPLGFIGLGIMGGRMAANLARAGYDMRVWNRTRETAEAWAEEHGGTVADSPRAAAEGAAAVITMVVDGPQVEQVLLGEDGATLHEAARTGHGDLYFEASVAGAIPLLRPLRESLAGDHVNRVLGIVNGTTNYILDKMDSTGASFTARTTPR